MAKKETAETGTENTFTKAQILASKKYANRRDLVSVLLKDDKKYSLEQVDALIENFMERKVK